VVLGYRAEAFQPGVHYSERRATDTLVLAYLALGCGASQSASGPLPSELAAILSAG